MKAPDAFRTLRVPAGSDAATVRRSYRILVKKLHPDLAGGGGNAARLDRVIEAYRFLCDHGYLPEPPRPTPPRPAASKPAPPRRGQTSTRARPGGSSRSTGGAGDKAPGDQAGATQAPEPERDADVFRLVDLLIAGETPETRAFAAQRLGGMGKKWPWAFLRNALNDPSDVVVKSAVGALGELGASRCAGELASIFYRGHAELRHAVLDAVERSARPNAFSGIILEALRAEQPEIRRRALRLFAQAKREEAG